MVDTSVWISVLRSPNSPEAPVFTQLLDSDEIALAVPVRTELLGGAPAKDRTPLIRALSALPVLYPTDATWQTLDRWTERTTKAGQRFGMADLLVAALTEEIGGLIWSLDADFSRMEKLKLVQCYLPK